MRHTRRRSLYKDSIDILHFFRFSGRPGKYNFVLGSYQQEACGTGGCFQELSIQLAVIMVGKQLLSALYEFLWPLLMKLLQSKKQPKIDHVSVSLDAIPNIVDQPHLP